MLLPCATDLGDNIFGSSRSWHWKCSPSSQVSPTFARAEIDKAPQSKLIPQIWKVNAFNGNLFASKYDAKEYETLCFTYSVSALHESLLERGRNEYQMSIDCMKYSIYIVYATFKYTNIVIPKI